MWILRKFQESAENFPVELSRLVSKSSDEISAKANLLNKLHSNILTPDKIPDFFLPPKLSRRSAAAAESIASRCLHEPGDERSQTSRGIPDATSRMLKTDKNQGGLVATRRRIKPIPFSVKNYEFGFFESPNTRRKESLFHSALSSYTLERMSDRAVPKLPSIALLKVGSLESDTSSSADSSPHSSPLPIRSKLETHSSKESLLKKDSLSSKNTGAEIRPARDEGRDAQTVPSTLAPPLRFPLDMLRCQERLGSEHVLLLPHRGCVRLSASRANADGALSTVRIRVISVEDLRDPGDPRSLHCGLTLSLSPGKLQQQHSAVIRNCRNPMFNEDFFFTETDGQKQSLRNLSVRVKVLEKNSGLGRVSVLGVIVKPLTELLAL